MLSQTAMPFVPPGPVAASQSIKPPGRVRTSWLSAYRPVKKPSALAATLFGLSPMGTAVWTRGMQAASDPGGEAVDVEAGVCEAVVEGVTLGGEVSVAVAVRGSAAVLVSVGELVIVGENVAFGDCVGVAEAGSKIVAVALGVSVREAVVDAVAVALPVAVAVLVGIGVTLGVSVRDGLAVRVAVREGEAVAVRVGVGVAAGSERSTYTSCRNSCCGSLSLVITIKAGPRALASRLSNLADGTVNEARCHRFVPVLVTMYCCVAPVARGKVRKNWSVPRSR